MATKIFDAHTKSRLCLLESIESSTESCVRHAMPRRLHSVQLGRSAPEIEIEKRHLTHIALPSKSTEIEFCTDVRLFVAWPGRLRSSSFQKTISALA
jgi:hypothetical protein